MKSRKSSTLMDVIMALMLVSIIIYFCYTLSTSAINKRVQINLERQAMSIAENIMTRAISTGTYMLKNEPYLDDAVLVEIENISNDENLSSSEKNERLLNVGGRLPVNTIIDAPFLKAGDVYANQYSYQLIISDYVKKTGVDASGNPIYSKSPDLKKITVNVYYPTKVVKYNKTTSGTEDISSLEDEYRVVTLSTYKAARGYEIYD